MEIVVKLSTEVDVKEFCKAINFVSEDVTNYRYIPESSKLIIECLPSTDKDLIVKSIINLAKKYKMGDIISEEMFKSKRIDNIYFDTKNKFDILYKEMNIEKNTNNKKAACVIPRPRSELFQRSSTST